MYVGSFADITNNMSEKMPYISISRSYRQLMYNTNSMTEKIPTFQLVHQTTQTAL